ncbi:MAG: hypothetical protein KatS3mg108_2946 [Isosphaeraceae bacterium]|nr:MAG: hypothetical protein KatS3mg108_2946 [Isosphaeraceae bacterium]
MISSWIRRVGAAGLLLLGAGCGQLEGPLPLTYSTSIQAQESLADKPLLRATIQQRLTELFGPSPDVMRVPPGAPLPEGGARLAAFAILGDESAEARPRRVAFRTADGQDEPIRGGYAIYREQCMHCHGASGDGNGPTAPFLWPAPRDYRPGIYKFTSTAGSGPDSKPTRDDLRRTIRLGIANSSMPAFESLLTPNEIEQVIDYVMFLSMRGEVEGGLLFLAQDLEDADAETELSPEAVAEVAELVFERWRSAESNVLNPKVPRPEPTRESIERGRRLFLGEKGLQCYGCHGLDGKGNGESFIDYRSFVRAVFEGNPSREKILALKEEAEKANKKWGDDWGNPIRPGNLTTGQYKGGRRPIDIYWRIAKGINGTPMPVHLGSQLTSDEEVWDLVNFVLALPYQPDLLEDAQPVAPGEATAGVAIGSAGSAGH